MFVTLLGFREYGPFKSHPKTEEVLVVHRRRGVEAGRVTGAYVGRYGHKRTYNEQVLP